MGTGEVSNLYIQNIERAFGVYWHCDSKDAISAKARGVGSQINSAMKQFNDNTTSVIHIGIDTYDGPEIEKRRFEKIKKTIENINPEETSVKWIFCNFFQAYSPPDQDWVFDETVSTISPFTNPISPIEIQLMIVPQDMYSSDYLNHWDRPLP